MKGEQKQKRRKEKGEKTEVRKRGNVFVTVLQP